MKALLLSIALLLIPSLAQAQYGQPRKPVPTANSFGYGYNRYTGTYNWMQRSTPLPTYGGYGSVFAPQAQYQIYSTPYGMGYQYQLPAMYQGNGGFFVPYSD